MTEIVATCRLVFDGMLVLTETQMTLSDQVKQSPNNYTFRFPLGLGGLHTLDVQVSFAERKR